MKRLYGEAQKLFQQRAFWILIFILVITDFLFIFMMQSSQNISSEEKTVQQELNTLLDEISLEEQLPWLKKETEIYTTLQSYEDSKIPGGDISLDKIEQQRYAEINRDMINAYASVYTDFLQYYDKINDYDTYIHQINKRLEAMQNGPMWKLYSKRKQQEVINQVQTYTNLKLNNLKPVHYQGVEAYTKNSISSILSLVFMIGLSILVLYEDEHDMKELLLSMKKGYHDTFFVKLILIAIISFIGTMALQSIDYLFHLFLYGSCAQNVAIQSIPSLYESPLSYTLWQWFLIFSVKKAFCISMLSTVFTMLYHLFTGRLLSILLFFMFFIVEAVAYLTIRTTSIISIFSYINIWRMLYGISLYLYTPIYYIGDISISLSNLLLLICLLIGIFSSLIYIWGKNISIRSSKHFPTLTFPHTRMFLQESFLLLWKQKGIWVIVTILILCNMEFMKSYNDTALLREQEKQIYAVYKPYLGKITSSEKMLLENEKQKIEKQETQMNETIASYQSGTISSEEYRLTKQQYQNNALYRYAFTQMYQAWEQHPEYIAYVKGYRAWYGLQEPTRNLKDVFLIMGGCISLFSGLFGNQKEEEQLYMTTYNGRSVRRKAVWKSAALYGSLLFLIVEGFSWSHFALLYPMGQSHAPLYLFHENVINFTYPLSMDMSIQQYGWMLFSSQLFGMITITILCVFVARYCKSRILFIVVMLVILFFPTFLYLSGLDFIRYISVFDLLMGNLFLQKSFSWIKIFIFLCSDIIMVYILHQNMKN